MMRTPCLGSRWPESVGCQVPLKRNCPRFVRQRRSAGSWITKAQRGWYSYVVFVVSHGCCGGSPEGSWGFLGVEGKWRFAVGDVRRTAMRCPGETGRCGSQERVRDFSAKAVAIRGLGGATLMWTRQRLSKALVRLYLVTR